MASSKAISELQRQQFAALTAKLGLSIPGDGEERVFAGYLQLLQMTELVRRSHQGTDEPALVFSPESILRGNEDD
jgi:hypothetical protein